MDNGVGVSSTETGNGGEDVYSSRESDASSADHLLVMVHGIMGSASDWKYAAEKFVQQLPDKVFVHCSERNTSKLTLDGVDVMGERLAGEVLEVIKRKPSLKKISFISHSVGGLVARYAIGILYKPPVEGTRELLANEESNGTIAGLEPVNFITVATPHLGSRGNKQVPFLFGVPAFEKVANCVIHLIFRRTGRHLFMNDDDEGKPPLLRRLVEDNEEHSFMSALRSFQRRVAYSNVAYDHIVGWRTSSIRRDSELPNWEDSVDGKYPHVVYEERCKAYDKEFCEPVVEIESSDDLEGAAHQNSGCIGVRKQIIRPHAGMDEAIHQPLNQRRHRQRMKPNFHQFHPENLLFRRRRVRGSGPGSLLRGRGQAGIAKPDPSQKPQKRTPAPSALSA